MCSLVFLVTKGLAASADVTQYGEAHEAYAMVFFYEVTVLQVL